jgi:hypothetical protein
MASSTPRLKATFSGGSNDDNDAVNPPTVAERIIQSLESKKMQFEVRWTRSGARGFAELIAEVFRGRYCCVKERNRLCWWSLGAGGVWVRVEETQELLHAASRDVRAWVAGNLTDKLERVMERLESANVPPDVQQVARTRLIQFVRDAFALRRQLDEDPMFAGDVLHVLEQSLVDCDFHQQRDGASHVFADANGRVYSVDAERAMLQPIRDAAEVAHMRLTLMARALPSGGHTASAEAFPQSAPWEMCAGLLGFALFSGRKAPRDEPQVIQLAGVHAVDLANSFASVFGTYASTFTSPPASPSPNMLCGKRVIFLTLDRLCPPKIIRALMRVTGGHKIQPVLVLAL